jgi:hypothetical protein
MLKSRKHVFWEALLIAVAIFIIGFLLGIAFENNQINKIANFYSQSEISLMDILAVNSLVDLDNSKCDDLIQANLDFADRIYQEAKIMEMYASAGKINEESFWVVHKRYDLLRSFLWINSQKIIEKCPENGFSSVVYLYNYQDLDIDEKATQNVWSKILFDLKSIHEDEIVLIPIAVDSDLVSLNSMIKKFEIKKYPAVIINNEFVFTELYSAEELSRLLNSVVTS